MSRIRRFVSTKRRLVVTAVTLFSLIVAAAVAYFTSTGSGTGSATVGANSPLTVHGSTSGDLYPGTSLTVNFTVDNPSTGHQQLGTIHLASIKACTEGSSWTGSDCGAGTEVSDCESVETGASDTTTANFWMPNVTENQDIGPNASGAAVTTTGTLTMNNLSSSQDVCQNANLTLNFTS